MMTAAGTPMAIHWKNVISTSAKRCSMPMPMRLGGVPTGVPIPPMEAANDVMSIAARANCRAPVPPVRARCAAIDSPIGYIMAVVAVLLIHMERTRRDPSVDDEHSPGSRPDESPREPGVHNPPIDAVHEHRLGQHEPTHEHEDDGISE